MLPHHLPPPLRPTPPPPPAHRRTNRIRCRRLTPRPALPPPPPPPLACPHARSRHTVRHRGLHRSRHTLVHTAPRGSGAVKRQNQLDEMPSKHNGKAVVCEPLPPGAAAVGSVCALCRSAVFPPFFSPPCAPSPLPAVGSCEGRAAALAVQGLCFMLWRVRLRVVRVADIGGNWRQDAAGL